MSEQVETTTVDTEIGGNLVAEIIEADDRQTAPSVRFRSPFEFAIFFFLSKRLNIR